MSAVPNRKFGAALQLQPPKLNTVCVSVCVCVRFSGRLVALHMPTCSQQMVTHQVPGAAHIFKSRNVLFFRNAAAKLVQAELLGVQTTPPPPTNS